MPSRRTRSKVHGQNISRVRAISGIWILGGCGCEVGREALTGFSQVMRWLLSTFSIGRAKQDSGPRKGGGVAPDAMSVKNGMEARRQV
jgi:hypothetical protein